MQRRDAYGFLLVGRFNQDDAAHQFLGFGIRPVGHGWLAAARAQREGAALFAILWVLRTRFRLPDGILTGVFFIAYAVLRIAGEFFREPDAPLTLMLTRGQFLSLFLVAMGLAFLVAAKIRPTWAPKFR